WRSACTQADLMRTSVLAAFLVLAGCSAADDTNEAGEHRPVTADPDETYSRQDTGTADWSLVPDVRCAGAPEAGSPGDFRHFRSNVISLLGDPRHRGFDLVTSAGTATQLLEGWISYTIFNKALEDEDVDVFACRAGEWQRKGTARTDGEGHFALRLSG